MAVWSLQWNYSYDMDTNFTVWTTEKAALQQGISEIVKKIDNDWDMDNEDMSRYTDRIKELRSQGKLREAINEWNEYQNHYNNDRAETYLCFMIEVLSGDDEVVKTPAPVAYQASSPGATCRGSHKEFNPYAYADQPDGSYLCTQCKTFQHIFGTTKP